MEKTILPPDSPLRPALVVKIGGSILSSQDTTLQDLVTLQQQGTICQDDNAVVSAGITVNGDHVEG